MKKFTILSILVLTTLQATASNNCVGEITRILEYPGKCDGNLAFKTNTTGEKWICALSDKSNSMILTAFAANKKVNVRLQLSVSGDCTSVPSHYVKPLYMSMSHDF